MKRKHLLFCMALGICVVAGGCGKTEIPDKILQENIAYRLEDSSQSTDDKEQDDSKDAEKSDAQASESIESEVSTAEMTTEELFDSFINGQVSAVNSEGSAFYITDLGLDSDEWDSFSVGEQEDLDNDGENELILCGPYGGIYLDARDGKVYEFAAGEGTGYELSYVVYNGATWIMYSNRMHAEYELFHMEKFEGADNLVAEMDFSREPVDGNDIESGMKYTWNGTEISSDEFEQLASKICATEVYTTK